jgi:hypothetical protein
MTIANESTVTVNFDGLMLFCFDEEKRLCEAKIHTAAEGHRMKIKVQAAGEIIEEAVIGQEELKTLHPLALFVDGGEGFSSIANSASKGEDYDAILDLEGAHFYQRRLKMKEGRYESSLYLHQGVIGAGNFFDDCFEVKQSLFESLKFEWESREEWEAFKSEALRSDPGSIVKIPEGSARDASATIRLREGQSFRLMSGRTKTDLLAKLAYGADYQIDIKYNDIHEPRSLADCVGFAHHCEAMELGEGEPIYGLFRPIFKGVSANTSTGCCRIARIAPPAQASRSFQAAG